MKSTTATATREVNSFEEYTLYSLERSTPTLLNMMERSKRIASLWPDVLAFVEAAGFCQEIAVLASFLESLHAVLDLETGESPLHRQWQAMRDKLSLAMESLENAIEVQAAGPIKRLFSVEIPETLNACVEVIPVVIRHLREEYITQDDGVAPATPAGG